MTEVMGCISSRFHSFILFSLHPIVTSFGAISDTFYALQSSFSAILI
jgi:hypothetical protein